MAREIEPCCWNAAASSRGMRPLIPGRFSELALVLRSLASRFQTVRCMDPYSQCMGNNNKYNLAGNGSCRAPGKVSCLLLWACIAQGRRMHPVVQEAVAAVQIETHLVCSC